MRLWFVAMVVMLCAGCQSTREPGAEVPIVNEVSSGESMIADEKYTKIEGGYLLYDNRSSLNDSQTRQMIYYYDEVTNSVTRMCTRPDCDHKEGGHPDDLTCPGAIIASQQRGSGVLIYQNRLLYLTNDDEGGHFYQADLNGENVSHFMDVSFDQIGAPIILCGDMLYGVITDVDFEEDALAFTEEVWLGGIHLKTQEQVFIEEANSHLDGLEMFGLYGEWLYYGMAAEGSRGYSGNVVRRWNIRTGQKETLDLGTGTEPVYSCSWGGDCLIFTGEETDGWYAAMYDLNTDEVTVFVTLSSFVHRYDKLETEIIYYVPEDGWKSYQLKTDTVIDLRKGDLQADFDIIGEVGDGYLLDCNLDGHAYIDKDDFAAGGNWMYLID